VYASYPGIGISRESNFSSTKSQELCKKLLTKSHGLLFRRIKKPRTSQVLLLVLPMPPNVAFLKRCCLEKEDVEVMQLIIHFVMLCSEILFFYNS
jgi:hypothetical protein